MVGDQDVLRLQVPVVDSQGMTELHGIQDLEKSMLGQVVVADEVALVGDAGEQVAGGTELKDHIGAIRGIHDAHQGRHVGMLAGQVVQADLALLELQLAGIQTGLVEGLDGKHDIGADIHGGVDDAVCADAQDAGQLQTVGQDEAQTVFGGIAAGGRSGRRSGKHWRVHRMKQRSGGRESRGPIQRQAGVQMALGSSIHR